MIRNMLQLAEIIAVIYCLAQLCGQKLKVDIYMTVLVLSDLFLFTGINEYGFPVSLSFLSYIALLTYCILKYQKGIRYSVLRCVAAILIVGVIQLIMNIPINYLFGEYKKVGLYDELLTNALVLAVVIVAMRGGAIKQVIDFIFDNNRFLFVVFASLAVLVGGNILYIKKTAYIENKYFLQMVYFIGLFFLAIKEWQKIKMDAEKKKVQLEMSALYYDAFEELIVLIREKQHDMKNHLNAILGMIHTIDDYEELTNKQKEYCNEVIENSKESKIILCIANPVIAGFLYRKIQEMNSKHIAVDYELALPEKKPVIPEYDIVELVGILLDNAVEALDVYSNEYRKIYIALCEREGALDIKVANRSNIYNAEEIALMFQKGYSNKGIGRGIGLYKLKKIVEEKNGIIEVSNTVYDQNNYLQFYISFVG